MRELSTRIFTAIVLIILVIIADFHLARIGFVLLFSLLTILAAWEWAGFLKWNKWYARLLYGLFILILCFAVLFVPLWIILFIGSIWWLSILAWLIHIYYTKKLPAITQSFIFIAGVLALVLCWRALVLLHDNPLLLLFLLIIVWGTDSFAYLGGIRWGQRKLIPIISPNKTWAGVFSAIGFTLLLSMALVWLFFGKREFSAFLWPYWVLPTIGATIVGDLFESLLKRHCNLKDSGYWLPGHGGLLDRIDGLIAAAPLFASGWFAFHLSL